MSIINDSIRFQVESERFKAVKQETQYLIDDNLEYLNQQLLDEYTKSGHRIGLELIVHYLIRNFIRPRMLNPGEREILISSLCGHFKAKSHAYKLLCV